MLVDPSLSDERHRLAKRFDDGGDQKVAAELDEIRRFRRFGDDESPLSDHVKKGVRQMNGVRRAAGDDEQVARFRGVGSTEHGRRDKALATAGMRLRQPIAQSRR